MVRCYLPAFSDMAPSAVDVRQTILPADERRLGSRRAMADALRVSVPTAVPGPAAAGPAAQKKPLHATARDTPRVQQARAGCQAPVHPLDLRRFRCMDESGVNLAMTRRFGRAPRGERVGGTLPQNYGANLTMMAARSRRGLGATVTMEGATDTDA